MTHSVFATRRISPAIRGLIAVMPLLVACARTTTPPQLYPRLADVRRVYVAPLGSDKDADGVREAIRQRLGDSGRFVVVDEASADAVLSGKAGVDRVETMGAQVHDPETGGISTSYDWHPAGVAQLQLIGVASRDTIWSFDAPKKASDRKPVATVAEQSVHRLLADAAAADSITPTSRTLRLPR